MWLEASIQDSDTGAGIGSARVAVVRVAEGMNHGVSVKNALVAELGDLIELFFEREADCLKHEFHNPRSSPLP